MKNSIYTTAAGMLTSAERLNVVSNNLANVNTNGFKGEIPFEQTLRFYAEGPYPGKDQPVLGGAAINMRQGIVRQTGRDLDLAFESPGYFTVQGPDNQQYYTRNGAFQMNSNRELVTADGYYVMDNNNRKITLFGDKVQISPKGEVFIDDNYFTSLKIVDIPNRDDVEKVGNTFLKMKDGTQSPTIMETPQIQSGALERSNVNIMAGITGITSTQRAFEMQKTAADVMFRIIRRTITDIPKPI
jgi:flagellar basal-body rod protein FlgF